MVHAYCYCYCWKTLTNLDDPPGTPHTNSDSSSSPHSHVGLCNGPGSKEPSRRPPPSPTEAWRSRASNCPPARPHFIDARSAVLRGPLSSPEPSHPTASSPHLDSRRLLVFRLKRLDESPLAVLLLEELEDLSEELSDPSQPIP